MPPLVSVITPCYNQAHFLADALESVRAQDYPDVEMLVVNDGSPDGDEIDRVVAEFAGTVTYIRQENQGIGAARNAALARCHGEFVQFLDSDDRLLPHAVRTGVAAFEAHPECALVWGYRNVIDANGGPIYDRVGAFPNQSGYADLLETNIIGPPVGVMVRRVRLDEIGGFVPALNYVEDYDMYLRMAARHPIHCHQQVVGEYRFHNNNFSSNDRMMLSGVLRALANQRTTVGNDRQLRQALRRGQRDAWDRYDWEPRIDRLRNTMRAGQWRQGVRDAIPLAARYPLRFAGAVLRPLKMQKGRSEK